jgi:hypothetical protein
MGGDVLQLKGPEVGDPREGGEDRRQREEPTSREDMTLDEIDRASGPLVGAAGNGDGLEQHHALGLEQRAAASKESVQILGSHRLDHLDGHELVVLAAELPIVAVEHRDPVAEAGALDALAGQLILVAGNGGGRDPAAMTRGGVQAKPPQPLPISRTWSAGESSSFRQTRSFFAVEASSRVARSLSKKAQE